ncbi:MAG: MFS transporter [Chloroflexia bacterium]
MAQAIAAPAPTTPPGDARRWLALMVVVSASFMATFDQFVVNVATPAMQRDLHASFAQIQFVVAGYALTYAVTLVTGGRLGDIFGRKRLFMVGMAGFTLASALCGLAPGPGLLVAARLFQGLGAALMAPQVLSIIQVTFPAAERGGALSVYGAAVGLASLAGQALGGLLIRANLFGLGWRVVFLVNIPIGVAALLAAVPLVRETRSPTARQLDLGGVAIITGGLFLFSFPLVAGRDAGWPAWSWACLIAAFPVLAAFVWFERRKTIRDESPLVALDLFRQRTFAAGLGVAFPFGMANPAMFFTLALYLQIGLQFSPLAAGLTFAPAPVGFFLAATFSARLARVLGRRLVLIAILMKAGAWTAIGLLVIRDGASLHGLALAPLMLIEGAGAGWTSPPLIGLSLAGVTGRDAGAAAGVFTTAQQIAGALGVALIGVVFFGALAGQAPGIAADLAPGLRARLASALPDSAVSATVADFQRCVADRASSRDPAEPPASCQVATLRTADPAIAPAIGDTLQRANALSYAHAHAIALFCCVGTLILASLASLTFPAPTPERPVGLD